MSSRVHSLLIAVACFFAINLSLAVMPVRGDFIEVYVPNSSLRVVLEGRVVAGREVTLQHKFGTLYFPVRSVEVHKVPTNAATYGKMASFARANKDADAMFAAAKWALKHALLLQFSQAIDTTLELDPQHAGALRVKALREKISKPMPETPEEEQRLRAILDRGTMRVDRSEHFIMLHDTAARSDEPKVDGARRRRPRSVERLHLLEQVYETFLMTFAAEGIELDVPPQRMQVILFSEFNDYQDFSKAINPVLSSAVGFWDPRRNVSVFYDNATDEVFQILQDILNGLQEQADQARRNRSSNAKFIVRNTNAMQVMVDTWQESSDIKVVTHEATHQLAGNTGLLPRYVRIPSWAHEGLATYFETPAEATWSGVGAVNESRLRYYRALAEDDAHSNIDFVVTDQIFDLAASHGAKLHAYAQAWALTHFLMENHLDGLAKYYALLAQMPPDITLNQEVLLKLFDRAFGKDRAAMTLEWRAYMRSLKTDFERAIESAR